MSLRGNWKVYKDPTFPKITPPAGRSVRFRVKSIDSLRRLVSHAAYGGLFLPKRRWLVGYGPGGEECVELDEFQFNVSNGLGRVQGYAADCKLEGLPSNPGFESFLLDLEWGSAFGWLSEMHVVALAGSGKEQDIECVYDERS